MSKLIKSAAKTETYQTRMDALVRVFNDNPDGQLVLDQIEEWAHSLWINHEGRMDNPSPYAWCPEKAVYKIALIDLVRRIRDDVKRHVSAQTAQKIQRETIS